MFRIARGPGANVRPHARQRKSGTSSSFFLRVPFLKCCRQSTSDLVVGAEREVCGVIEVVSEKRDGLHTCYGRVSSTLNDDEIGVSPLFKCAIPLCPVPEPESDWPAAARVKWLQTAANIFDLIYKGDGGITVSAAMANRSPRPHE
jgi:hypothetical protein